MSRTAPLPEAGNGGHSRRAQRMAPCAKPPTESAGDQGRRRGGVLATLGFTETLARPFPRP